MATPYPSLDGRSRRPRSGERMVRTTFSVVALCACVAAPVSAVSLWLLLTDPVVAGEVADSQSVLPVVERFIALIGEAVAALLAYL